MRTMEALQIEHERRTESESGRFVRLVALACHWLDDADGKNSFVPNDQELDRNLRTRTGACARQLLRTLGGLE